MRAKSITERQKEVLKILYDHIKSSGFPPSFKEAKEQLGISSNQSYLDLLQNLEKCGCIKRQEGQARGIKILPLGFKILKKQLMVPFAGISSAGPYIESYNDAFSKWIELPNQVLENERVQQSEENVFVIKMYGDSMINAGIDDGDILLIKQAKEFRNGDVVVARSDDGTTVKTFVAENKKAYLKPENPKYQNIPIFEETYFDGKVILNLSKLNK